MTAPAPTAAGQATTTSSKGEGTQPADTPESAHVSTPAVELPSASKPAEPSAGTDSLGAAPTPASPATSPRGSTIWESRTPKTEAPAETQPPAQSEVTTPIERLHRATVAAAERGDLDELRRLRATWKSFMGKIIGPDRARAKREYADCLWSIQDATGRGADERDALAAYREYLLGAPAGGADSRSVSRLRQLEDALTERR